MVFGSKTQKVFKKMTMFLYVFKDSWVLLGTRSLRVLRETCWLSTGQELKNQQKTKITMSSNGFGFKISEKNKNNNVFVGCLCLYNSHVSLAVFTPLRGDVSRSEEYFKIVQEIASN